MNSISNKFAGLKIAKVPHGANKVLEVRMKLKLEKKRKAIVILKLNPYMELIGIYSMLHFSTTLCLHAMHFSNSWELHSVDIDEIYSDCAAVFDDWSCSVLCYAV
jgi:hypothetical protein